MPQLTLFPWTKVTLSTCPLNYQYSSLNWSVTQFPCRKCAPYNIRLLCCRLVAKTPTTHYPGAPSFFCKILVVFEWFFTPRWRHMKRNFKVREIETQKNIIQTILRYNFYVFNCCIEPYASLNPSAFITTAFMLCYLLTTRIDIYLSVRGQ